MRDLLPDARPRMPESGGADRDRTDDPLLAKQVLSQAELQPRFQESGVSKTRPRLCLLIPDF